MLASLSLRRHLAGRIAVQELRNTVAVLGLGEEVADAAESEARELARASLLDLVGACREVEDGIRQAYALGLVEVPEDARREKAKSSSPLPA